MELDDILEVSPCVLVECTQLLIYVGTLHSFRICQKNSTRLWRGREILTAWTVEPRNLSGVRALAFVTNIVILPFLQWLNFLLYIVYVCSVLGLFCGDMSRVRGSTPLTGGAYKPCEVLDDGHMD